MYRGLEHKISIVYVQDILENQCVLAFDTVIYYGFYLDICSVLLFRKKNITAVVLVPTINPIITAPTIIPVFWEQTVE